jgi:hypothetical protein
MDYASTLAYIIMAGSQAIIEAVYAIEVTDEQ